ncbi:Arylesterase precursor [Pseudohaliea rubra DSM 19751]|uniref:Arylesterase n=1 Tax=Pseudohaliea rubra DSM 19751 TaxID=1265313 RepID=A0A095XUM7_9GAMM|nr:Arylesterase precursor [Pseudohaliea rubra DSM 19751]
MFLLLAGAALAGDDRRLLVLGDSISAAYGLSLEEGWVALAELALAERGLSVEVINASISGETSAGGRRRLPALVEAHNPDAVVIELGGNDGLRGYPVAQLRQNLAAMVSVAQDHGAEVLLLPMEIPPNYGPRYTGTFRKTFELVANEAGATLGPFPLEAVATDPALMQADGIHPTAAAQPRIVDTLLPALEKVLRP